MLSVVTDIPILDDDVTCKAFNISVFYALTWRSPSIVWVFAMHGAKMLGQVARLAAVFTVRALAPLILSHLNDKASILKPAINLTNAVKFTVRAQFGTFVGSLEFGFNLEVRFSQLLRVFYYDGVYRVLDFVDQFYMRFVWQL